MYSTTLYEDGKSTFHDGVSAHGLSKSMGPGTIHNKIEDASPPLESPDFCGMRELWANVYDEDVPVGHVGDYLKGMSVMKEYYKIPRLLPRLLSTDGCIPATLPRRIRTAISIGGENVYPVMEEVIQKHPTRFVM